MSTNEDYTQDEVEELENKRRIQSTATPETASDEQSGSTDTAEEKSNTADSAASQKTDDAPSAEGQSIPSSVDPNAPPVQSDETASSGAASDSSPDETQASGGEATPDSPRQVAEKHPLGKEARKTLAFLFAGAIVAAVMIMPMAAGRPIPEATLNRVWPLVLPLLGYATGGDLAAVARSFRR